MRYVQLERRENDDELCHMSNSNLPNNKLHDKSLKSPGGTLQSISKQFLNPKDSLCKVFDAHSTQKLSLLLPNFVSLHGCDCQSCYTKLRCIQECIYKAHQQHKRRLEVLEKSLLS